MISFDFNQLSWNLLVLMMLFCIKKSGYLIFSHPSSSFFAALIMNSQESTLYAQPWWSMNWSREKNPYKWKYILSEVIQGCCIHWYLLFVFTLRLRYREIEIAFHNFYFYVDNQLCSFIVKMSSFVKESIERTRKLLELLSHWKYWKEYPSRVGNTVLMMKYVHNLHCESVKDL